MQYLKSIINVHTVLELFKERFKSYNKVVCICALIISYSYISANEELDDSLENQGLKASRFMPLNKPNLRVKIPQFKNGELDCVIKADEMTRVDDENVKIENMEIDFFESGDKEMKVLFQSAKYNFLKNKIDSNNKTQVIRPNYFTLTGDSLEFDVEQKQGRMVGKVRMVLKNSKVVINNKKDLINDINPSKNTFFFIRKINSLLEAIQEDR